MKIKGKKILVAGGAGFIGSHLCERLLKEGAEVAVLDDFSTGKMDNLKGIKNSVSIKKGDISDAGAVDRAVKGCDAIVHLAFPYGRSGMELENQYVREGVEGTFNLLRSAVKRGAGKLVNASTVSVYGISRYFPIDESHPVEPFLLYGATKAVGESYCSIFSNLYGLDTSSLRYFFIYGPRYSVFDHNAIVNFMNRALKKQPFLIYGDGSQVRDYTYIDDCVEATVLALKKDGLQGRAYNVSSGKKINIRDLAEKVRKASGEDIPINFAKMSEYRYIEHCKVPVGTTTKKGSKWIDERNYTADLSLAEKDLGFKPKVDLETGIKRTLDWLRSKQR